MNKTLDPSNNVILDRRAPSFLQFLRFPFSCIQTNHRFHLDWCPTTRYRWQSETPIISVFEWLRPHMVGYKLLKCGMVSLNDFSLSI